MYMLGKAVIEKVTDNAEDQQECQISLLEDEVVDETERMQNYGFTSNPKPGADAFVAFIGGNRDHGIIIAVDDRRYRLKPLQSGEVAMYTDEGDKIVMKRGNKIEITAAVEVSIVSPLTKMSGNLQVTGSVQAASLAATGASTAASMTASGEITAAGVPLSTHKHAPDETPPHA